MIRVFLISCIKRHCEPIATIALAILATRIETVLSILWIDIRPRRLIQDVLGSSALGQQLAAGIQVAVLRIPELIIASLLGILVFTIWRRRRTRWRNVVLAAIGFSALPWVEFYVSTSAVVRQEISYISYCFSVFSGILVVVSAVLTCKLSREARENVCPRCSYDLRGTVSGICSECGLPLSGSACESIVNNSEGVN